MGKGSDSGLPLFDRLVDAEVEEERARSTPRRGDRDNPLTVTEALKTANRALDSRIGTIWIEGEAAEVSRSAAGHVYFTLKDESGQLSAIMWASDVRRLRFELEEGVRLLCRGNLGVYEASGRFQFYAKTAQPAGVGEEALALEQLKQKLAAEGLFDAERKRPLPALPARIGVVTSRAAAALRDIIRVVQRRFPVPILLADAQVQGADAPRQIVEALEAIARHSVDVVIVGRGGGSAQDLAAFNDERVVRAVAACPVPTISAVGHEVDVTLTDLAADRRAATPSQAGEIVVPVLADLSAALDKEQRRLDRELALVLRHARQELEQLAASAQGHVGVGVAQRRRVLGDLEKRLAGCHPAAQLTANRALLRELDVRSAAAFERRAERGKRAIAELSGRLHAMSPLRTLERGYAIARAGEQVLTAATQVSPGDAIDVRLARGSLDCRVEQVRDQTKNDSSRDDEE